MTMMMMMMDGLEWMANHVVMLLSFSGLAKFSGRQSCYSLCSFTAFIIEHAPMSQ